MTRESQDSIFGTTTLDPKGEANTEGRHMHDQSPDHGGDAPPPEQHTYESFGKVVKHVERGTHAHLKRASELLQKNINVNRKP